GLPQATQAELLASARAYDAPPASVEALINRSHRQVSLRLDHLDDALTDRLLMAQQRGVDVRVVLTPPGRMDEYEVQRVLALTDSGVDLKVTDASRLT